MEASAADAGGPGHGKSSWEVRKNARWLDGGDNSALGESDHRAEPYPLLTIDSRQLRWLRAADPRSIRTLRPTWTRAFVAIVSTSDHEADASPPLVEARMLENDGFERDEEAQMRWQEG